VRLGAIGLGVKGAESAVDVDVAMGAIGIVGTAKRCRRIAVRRFRFRRLGVLVRAIMLLSTTRCWRLRRVLVGMRKRLARVLRERMGSAGGEGVADGGGDVGLRARARVRHRLGMRRMGLM
jgi:hypothetical protein